VFKWCDSNEGRMIIHEDHGSGRPSIITDEFVQKIKKTICEYHQLTVNNISAIFPQLSRSLLHETKYYDLVP